MAQQCIQRLLQLSDNETFVTLIRRYQTEAFRAYRDQNKIADRKLNWTKLETESNEKPPLVQFVWTPINTGADILGIKWWNQGHRFTQSLF